MARVKLGENGRVVIPAEVRKDLNLQTGDDLLLTVEDGEIRICSQRQAYEKARSLVQRFIPKDVSLVDELIAHRREEAGREAKGP